MHILTMGSLGLGQEQGTRENRYGKEGSERGAGQRKEKKDQGKYDKCCNLYSKETKDLNRFCKTVFNLR